MSERSNLVAQLGHRAHVKSADCARLLKAQALQRELVREYAQGYAEAMDGRDAAERQADALRDALLEAQLKEQRLREQLAERERLLDDRDNEIRRLREALRKLAGERAVLLPAPGSLEEIERRHDGAAGIATAGG